MYRRESVGLSLFIERFASDQTFLLLLTLVCLSVFQKDRLGKPSVEVTKLSTNETKLTIEVDNPLKKEVQCRWY